MVAVLLVVAVAVGIWLLNGRDPGTATDPGEPADTGVISTQAVLDEPTGSPTSVSLDPDSGLPYVDLADLPVEAADTVDLIDAGGPFPYPAKDGSTFGNFEGRLPDEPRGYYAEYTVPTPGEDDRGARRIVAGEEDELYWTEDHYASFERIRR
jgi:ribonuclease T1